MGFISVDLQISQMQVNLNFQIIQYPFRSITMYQKQRAAKSYSITSPYTDLLESKKKVYGLKYHSSFGNASHSKSTHNQSIVNSNSGKARPASSSLASHHSKSGMKSNSSEKMKSTKSQNPKRKRIYTEQAQNFNQLSSDPKMHESLFVNMDQQKNTISQLANNKSILNNELEKRSSYINNYDFLKKFSEFNANLKQKQQHINYSGSKSQKSNKSTKSKGKTKVSQPMYNRSINFETINFNPAKSVQQLGLTEVEDLICLIDNCVEQANEYISFLAGKVESLKNELMKCKAEEFQLERIIKEKNKQLQTKDLQIAKLKKQLENLKNQKFTTNQSISSSTAEEDFKGKEIKKILEVLNQMNERNQFLESKVKGLQDELVQKKTHFTKNRQDQEQWVSSQQKVKEKRRNSNNKDIYNQIHSKIDILNISIDNNKKSTQNTNNYTYPADPDRSQHKKYKFIKPKNK